MSPLFIITGLSGAGKSTLVERLFKQHPDTFARFVTTTTREPRPDEQNGKHYWFVSPETFERGLKQDQFYEWATVYDKYYGLHKQEMQRLQQLEQPMVLVTDVQGAQTMKRLHPEACLIFIDAPREDLLRRLQNRHMAPDDFEKRVKKINEESTLAAEADVVILNRDGELPKSVDMLEHAIQRRLA